MKKKLKYLALALMISPSLFSGAEGTNTSKLTFKQQYQLETLISAMKDLEEELSLSDLETNILKELKMESKFNAEERKAVRNLATYFDVPLSYMYKLFYLESRGNPKAVNRQPNDPKDPLERIKLGRAVGLIQWMPFTAKHLNTSTEKLYSMTVIEQLEYVKLYLERINPSKKFDSFTDLYLAVLYPYAINKADSYILGSHLGERSIKITADQNSGIDKNKDGQISKSEVCSFANC